MHLFTSPAPALGASATAATTTMREELTAMASSLTECEGCPQGTCEGCDVLASEGAPRSLRVLLQE